MINMKKFILGSFMLGVILPFVSCSRENIGLPLSRYAAAKDTVTFSVVCRMAGMKTKSTVNDMAVENINLYIFNEWGDLAFYEYYENTCSIDLSVCRNGKHTVYLLANAGKKLHAKSESGMASMLYSIRSAEEIASGEVGVLMAGKTLPQPFEDGQTVEVELVRCVSKINLQCNFDALNPDVEIGIKTVGLKNIPNCILPFAMNRIENDSSAIDGEVVVAPDGEMLERGIVFYQFENMQGTLQPQNVEQSGKVLPVGSIYEGRCSYIEMSAAYSSPRKRGEIIYRFYLGEDMTSNYDVTRNTQYNVVVGFAGDGSVGENTWRVDCSNIVDLVTSVVLDTNEYIFEECGATMQLKATVLPATANERTLLWSSSDESVATVDSNGLVTAVNDGNCTISATSVDGTEISAFCNITVDSKVHVETVKLSESYKKMYKGMKYTLKATIKPSDATYKGIVWHSTDESVASVDQEGNVVGGSKLGTCFIVASSEENGAIADSCQIDLSPRYIVSIVGERDITIKVGEPYQLKWYTNPSNLKPTFKDYNSYITVSEDGVVIGTQPTSTPVFMHVFGGYDFYNITVVE